MLSMNPKTPTDFQTLVNLGKDAGLEVWRDSIGTYSYRTIEPRGPAHTVQTLEQLWQDVIDEGLKNPLPPITLLQSQRN